LAEAVIVNPNHAEEIAAGLKTALEMPEHEQIRRNEIMQERLQRYDVVRWADDFLSQLPAIKAEQEHLQAQWLGPAARKKLLHEYQQATRRTIFLDYDGTLVPFADVPENARPGRPLLTILRDLCRSGSDIVLISGRDKDTMQNWFADLGMTLVAEHGAWIKPRDGKWQLIRPLDSGWKQAILPILQTYTDRLPGAFIEQKQCSVVWHYRRADPELASTRVRELVDDLVNYTANMDVQVLQGNKVVEVRSGGINKGAAAKMFLPKDAVGTFVLAVGDDWTDEDLFRALPGTACTIKVGNRHSCAKFNLRSHIEVLELLNEIRETQPQECGL
ncbi:MAG: trehalose-phosphatase, partial [Planctomycetes bacterium RBG_13_62_9]